MVNSKSKLHQLLSSYKKPVIGIGVTAFTRTGPAFLLPNYKIIALLETADLAYVRKICPVLSLEKDFDINPETLEKQNTSTILLQEKVFNFLKNKACDASLLAYKSSRKIETICQGLG